MHWVSSEAAVPMGPGAKFVSVKVRGEREFTLSLVFFDADHYDLRVFDQPNRRRGASGEGGKSIAQAAAELNGIAGCNGGYFTPSFGPHGLMIADGVVNKTDVVASMGGAGGAVVVRGGKAQIIVDTTFVDSSDVSEFVQCCPLFIVNGKPIADMSGGPRAPRTFILTDNKGHWALGNSTAMGLQEMSDALRLPGVITDFKIDMALNLDGGPSTGMWWKDAEGKAHDHPPSWPVRNYLLVTKKPKS
jgi:exopolysaccharide biosynthesis protein